MQLAGRLVGDAQLRETKSGQRVTAFTVALNDSFKKKDGTKVQNTTFVDCAVWNRPNLTDYLVKGLLVELIGFPSPRAYNGKDGEPQARIDFRVDRLNFLGGGQNKKVTAKSSGDQTPGSKDKEDDLPF